MIAMRNRNELFVRIIPRIGDLFEIFQMFDRNGLIILIGMG